MQNLFMKIASAIEAIEDDKGKFTVKCLAASDPDDIQWALILSADWFKGDQSEILSYLADKVLKDLDDDCMTQFYGIIPYGPEKDNELLRELKKIQNNYANGRYTGLVPDDPLEIRTQLPQARLVIPLNRTKATT